MPIEYDTLVLLLITHLKLCNYINLRQVNLIILLKTENVRCVHAGPPCGTYTRALEKRVPKWKRDLGAPDPQPLRKDWCPEGLSSLTGVRLIKVQKANVLTNFVARVVRLCCT